MQQKAVTNCFLHTNHPSDTMTAVMAKSMYNGLVISSLGRIGSATSHAYKTAEFVYDFFLLSVVVNKIYGVHRNNY